MSRVLILRISLPVLTFIIALLAGLSNIYTDWSWYESLNKSSLNPPDYLFGRVWPILYTLMAVVSFLHAKSISFELSGEHYELDCPIDKELESVLARLRGPR